MTFKNKKGTRQRICCRADTLPCPFGGGAHKRMPKSHFISFGMKAEQIAPDRNSQYAICDRADVRRAFQAVYHNLVISHFGRACGISALIGFTICFVSQHQFAVFCLADRLDNVYIGSSMLEGNITCP